MADAFVDTRIGEVKKYLEAMHHVLASGYISRKDVLLAAREVLASIGESHSAFNSVEMLKANGVNAILLDLGRLPRRRRPGPSTSASTTASRGSTSTTA